MCVLKNMLQAITLFALVTPCAAVAQIQMLPPIQSGTANTVCPASGVNNFLTWDGATALKCQAGIVVDNSGHVGIGLPLGTLPTHTLDLEGDLATFPGIYIKPTNINRTLALRWDNGGNVTEIVTDAAAFRIATGGSERLTVLSSGDVGIGTAAPGSKLDVAGGVKIGMDGASCTTTKAGTLRYNNGQVEVCNGAGWANAFASLTYIGSCTTPSSHSSNTSCKCNANETLMLMSGFNGSGNWGDSVNCRVVNQNTASVIGYAYYAASVSGTCTFECFK